MSPFREYVVWWRHHTKLIWSKTAHTLKARTDKEAQSRMQRMFSNARFTSLSLVAVPVDMDPNE